MNRLTSKEKVALVSAIGGVITVVIVAVAVIANKMVKNVIDS